MTGREHAPFNLLLVDEELRELSVLRVGEEGVTPAGGAAGEGRVVLQLLGAKDAPLEEMIRDGRVKVLAGADLLISESKLLRQLAGERE